MSVSSRAFSALAIAAGLVAAGTSQAQSSLTVISFGGVNQQAQIKAFYEPFTKSTQIQLVKGEYNGEQAKVKAMVEAKQLSAGHARALLTAAALVALAREVVDKQLNVRQTEKLAAGEAKGKGGASGGGRPATARGARSRPRPTPRWSPRRCRGRSARCGTGRCSSPARIRRWARASRCG